MDVHRRIVPAQPPFAPEIASVLRRIMPEGVAPLALFTTLARNPRVFQHFMAGGLGQRIDRPLESFAARFQS